MGIMPDIFARSLQADGTSADIMIRKPKADPQWVEALKKDTEGSPVVDEIDPKDAAGAMDKYREMIKSDPAGARRLANCWLYFKERGFEP